MLEQILAQTLEGTPLGSRSVLDVSERAPPEEERKTLPPLTKEQRKTLNLLDKWTKSERGSASKLYGAAGVRATNQPTN
eukprot:5034861-Pyramimonas_sp.AAC.1